MPERAPQDERIRLFPSFQARACGAPRNDVMTTRSHSANVGADKNPIGEHMRKFWIAAAVAAAFALPASAQAQKPETTKVRLAVGGKSSLYYLPLTITERLGYFKEAGLDVEISDFAGGAKSLQALIGGSADVVTGSFDHTIQMQAKNQSIVALVQIGRFPGVAIALRQEKAANYNGPKDLKGM